MSETPVKTPVGKKRRPGAGPLLLLSALFLTSGAVRLSANLDDLPDLAALAQRENAASASQVICSAEPGVAELLAAIQARQKSLDERERALDEKDVAIGTRLAALRGADVELTRTMQAVEAAEQKLQNSLSLAATVLEEDVSTLVAVYESMKPKDAAILFQTMSPEFASGFLAHMRPEVVAEILAGLPPELAYGISVIIAGRNAGSKNKTPDSAQ